MCVCREKTVAPERPGLADLRVVWRRWGVWIRTPDTRSWTTLRLAAGADRSGSACGGRTVRLRHCCGGAATDGDDRLVSARRNDRRQGVGHQAGPNLRSGRALNCTGGPSRPCV